MLPTPYYEAIGFDEAFAYYAAVADAIDIPICTYNFPPATGLHLDVDFLLRLADEIPNVKYVKDSSADIAQMNTLICDHPDRIVFFNGEDVLMLPALMLKAPGMVMGVANFMTPALKQMHELSQSGRDGEAVAIWRKVNPVLSLLAGAPYTSGVKAACACLGLDVGEPRAPVTPYSQAQRRTLRALLDGLDADLLTSAAGR